MNSIRAEDAAAAAQIVGPLWATLKGARILLTGATGFLGGALVESFLHANEELGLGARVVVLTRDPEAARRRHPWLVNEAITLVGGDIAAFVAPRGGFTHCVHGAGVASMPQSAQDSASVSRTIQEGTRHCLETAIQAGVKDFLFVSSGAVYGPQPASLPALPEDFVPGQLSSQDHYARAKRAAEELCLAASPVLASRIARCFSFLGPGIPLDAHYAAGNFIRDALAGGPVRIEGDGTAVRSYLYSADAAAWLWTILLSGAKGGIYNVGSSESVTIHDLAREVARGNGNLRVELLGRAGGASSRRYVPSVARAEADLGLRPSVPLPEAIRRTLAWARTTGYPVETT